MKNLLTLICAGLLLTGCVHARSVHVQDPTRDDTLAGAADLSTDEGVRAELQKVVDARNTERAGDDERLKVKLRAADRLKPEDVCIGRLKESAKVIAVGFFRYDYGCHFDGAFVGPRYFEAADIGLHGAALRALGWDGADKEGRERLALAWVEKGLLAFFNVPRTDPKGLERFGFHPPQAVSAEQGAVKVTLWFQVPPGRNGGRGFQHVEYRFNGDGSLSGVSTLDAVQL